MCCRLMMLTFVALWIFFFAKFQGQGDVLVLLKFYDELSELRGRDG